MMTDNPQHSSTPWKKLWCKNKEDEYIIEHPETLEGIAFCPKESNAKHIVHCVNNHDALVSALEDIAGINDVDGNSPVCECDDDMRRLAIKALNNAKGESDGKD